ncbi:hypothetical protein [Rhodococcoides kyotonense]|uniref:Uncharacterized protein n=1 Tax=Rhodococcoides kyotonense TaxID=398843 RepID=A0A239J1S3_9NOCA|nr:hypothetical protein [Rhodococcus kyotonensis]SNS99715.1 hypothetical protein SAMN05421642_1086 [Rhodococcus kyotonensis]
MNTARTHARGSAWSTAAVIVGIVAAGTVVAGLLNDPQSEAITIPGCDEVVQPEDMQRINYAFVGADSYDDLWFSEEKATAMSDALAGALPADAVVEPPLSFDSDATAHGTVSVNGNSGQLTVRVWQSDEPAGPCFAGYVDERRSLSDGTVLDISGERVIAYVPDGSRIDVNADNVFTVKQLTDIATTPGLRVSESSVPE